MQVFIKRDAPKIKLAKTDADWARTQVLSFLKTDMDPQGTKTRGQTTTLSTLPPSLELRGKAGSN